MSNYPSIHDAYGGFGDRENKESATTTMIQPKKN